MYSLILHLSFGFLNPAWASTLVRPCRCTVGTRASFLACQPATYWRGKGWALGAEPGLCLPTKWISGIPVWIIRALSPGVHVVVGCVIRGQSLHFVLCSQSETPPPRCATQICKWEVGVWPYTQNSCFHRSKSKRREDGEISRGRTLGIWEMPGKVRELKEGLAQTKWIR